MKLGTLVLAAWTLSIGAASAIGQQLLRIHLFDYAGVPQTTLNRASVQVKTALASAGVGADLSICRAPELRGACRPEDGSTHLIVRIIRKDARLGEHAFGAAIKPLDPSVRGVYATIFYSRIAEASRRFGTEPDALLASAIAHEVGELMGLEHASAGFMHAALGAADVEKAARGQLAFSEMQAEALRRALSERLAENALKRADAGHDAPASGLAND